MADITPTLPEDEIGYLTALELRARYRRRELSPVEVVEATLRRIERLNPHLVAFITVTSDVAIRQARAAERAARRFEELGCHVEEVSRTFEQTDDIWVKLWASSNAAVHAEDFERVRDRIDPGRLPMIELGQRLSGVEVTVQQIRRAAFYRDMIQFMEGYDLLLTPTLARTAFAAGESGPTDIAGEPMANPGDWSPFCAPFNLTGQPAASVPCGFDDTGLPIGLQIVGRWHDDSTVLRAAAAFEAIAPWAHLHPPLGGITSA